MKHSLNTALERENGYRDFALIIHIQHPVARATQATIYMLLKSTKEKKKTETIPK